VGKFGKTGTYKVCRDGSLMGGGIEVATVGRRVQFDALYDMVSMIMGLCLAHKGYVDERCSIHIHLLASYLTPNFSENDTGGKVLKSEITEMEMPMPEIILANFHQLVRRYQNALVWMSAAGPSRSHLTRWEKFRKSVLPYSAACKKMPLVTRETARASKSKRKYALMNYEQVKYDKEGRVTRLHVEGRHPDGNYSPAAVVAHACLLYGLMIKAVEISRYGVLEAGDKVYMERQKEICAHLCNNDGPWDGSRHSDTSRLDPYIPDLRKQSRQLIRLVKITLSELYPADEILRCLAEEPLAFRLIKKKSWEQIEKELLPEAPKTDELGQEIMRLINLGAICECDNTSEWIDTATHVIADSRGVGNHKKSVNELRQEVTRFISEQLADRRARWSKAFGGYVGG
jgi:hypothetical protein